MPALGASGSTHSATTRSPTVSSPWAGGVASWPRQNGSARSEQATTMAPEAIAEATPATVNSGLPDTAPFGEQHFTLGSVSSTEPPTMKLALPAPSAAAMIATSAAMMATMIARIFHHGSENGR